MNYELEVNRKRFDPFTRAGVTYTPVWVHRTPGEVIYDITHDAHRVVMRPHWRLVPRCEPTPGAPDAGSTPMQAGYQHDREKDCPPYLCDIPPWVSFCGIDVARFGRMVADLGLPGLRIAPDGSRVIEEVTHGG